MRFILKIMLLCLTFIGSEALAASDSLSQLQHLTQKKFKKYKSVLEHSTWIVPPSTLLAVEYAAGISIPVMDQTVWTIHTFENGYFSGDAYVAINGSPTSHMKLVGSVTPLGDVYITFYPTAGNLLNTDVITGLGKLARIEGQYTFVMQMSSGPNNLIGLSHWSYMISVDKNDYFYQNLPSLNMSVPQFISLFTPL